jgi:hypothetical protein
MPPLQRTTLLAALTVVLAALAFAVYTDHVWEDYYITWRSSKNLATGHGLVYNHGDRLHTFTSPLGVLLPALASVLVLNSSDAAALWLFRLMSCAALGGTAALLLQTARRQDYARLAVVLLVGGLALDAKTLDFSINGMETAFLLLFLAYAFWAHLAPGPRQWRHLGCAWAGLMWTRPDGFIYIGLVAAGFWLFNEEPRSGHDRRGLLGLYLRAGLLTTVLYLPWFLFAWGYYGTPVPHTVTAKSGIGEPRTLAGLLHAALHLPFTALSGGGSMEGTFLPAYYMIGTWPQYLIWTARGLAVACSLLWLLPFLRMETRASSLAFFGVHAYLSYYPYFPFPWYLPGTTLLAVFCLGSLVAHILAVAGRWRSLLGHEVPFGRILGFLGAATLLFLLAHAWFTWQSARLFAAQQRYIENGNRRKIGEWLRANARPGDTVFLEPLGYIGYFSGLKTYDFPGLSSREVVAARAAVGVSWARLIERLKPQWVVLRPHEAQRVADDRHDLLTGDYELVREFSVEKEIAGLPLPGRDYLAHDARFLLYERLPDLPRRNILHDESPFPLSRMTVEGVETTFAHAPSTLVRPVPRSAGHATVQFGFVPAAYADRNAATDGATFVIAIVTGDTFTELFRRTLDPAANPADRGLQTASVDLPARSERSHLLLRVESGKSMSKDWTCWSDVEFR